MCNNYEYRKNRIAESDKIWIDTSTLMHSDRMKVFIDETKDILINQNKKITVHNMVMSELYKFSDCNNYEKKELADKAIAFINNNRDIFDIESALNRKYEYNKYNEIFADHKLLIELLFNCRYKNQLLISNDHDLTSDAFKLNSFSSFNGRKVNVCYLNYYGKMHMCECVKHTSENEFKNIVYKDRIIEKIVEKPVEREHNFLKKHDFEIGLLTGTLITSIIFNWKYMVKTFKSYI